MNTGALRHHVTLDGPAPSFTPLDPPDWWCAIRDEAATQITFVGRYHPGITPAARVHYRGRTYQVTAVANRDARNVELVVTGDEVFD